MARQLIALTNDWSNNLDGLLNDQAKLLVQAAVSGFDSLDDIVAALAYSAAAALPDTNGSLDLYLLQKFDNGVDTQWTGGVDVPAAGLAGTDIASSLVAEKLMTPLTCNAINKAYYDERSVLSVLSGLPDHIAIAGKNVSGATFQDPPPQANLCQLYLLPVRG